MALVALAPMQQKISERLADSCNLLTALPIYIVVTRQWFPIFCL